MSKEEKISKTIKKYFNEITDHIKLENYNINKFKIAKSILINCKKKGGKLIFLGNGGSAATCNHLTTDFTKNAKIKSINFNDSALITCFCNDYGHDKWMSKALEFYSNKNDVVFFISVSGESKNLVNAIKYCLKKKMKIVTLTGRKKNNTLMKLNKKSLNFWVDSHSYNIVEIVHHAWLLSLVDLVIGKSVYETSKKKS